MAACQSPSLTGAGTAIIEDEVTVVVVLQKEEEHVTGREKMSGTCQSIIRRERRGGGGGGGDTNKLFFSFWQKASVEIWGGSTVYRSLAWAAASRIRGNSSYDYSGLFKHAEASAT